VVCKSRTLGVHSQIREQSDVRKTNSYSKKKDRERTTISITVLVRTYFSGDIVHPPIMQKRPRVLGKGMLQLTLLGEVDPRNECSGVAHNEEDET
jgi:hypothetical protein